MRFLLPALLVLAALASARPVVAQALAPDDMAGEILRVFVQGGGEDGEEGGGPCSQEGNSCIGSGDDEKACTYVGIAIGAFLVIGLIWSIANGERLCIADEVPADERPSDLAPPETDGVVFVGARAGADVVLDVTPQRRGVRLGTAPDRLAVRARDARTGRPLALDALGATEVVVVGDAGLRALVNALADRN